MGSGVVMGGFTALILNVLLPQSNPVDNSPETDVAATEVDD